jgi:ubiquinone/menaquinone biosynthesis C-methylase UbiE
MTLLKTDHAGLATIQRPLSPRANLAELRYRNEIQLRDPKYDSLDRWRALTRVGTRRIVPFLVARGEGFHGRVLEIGAGACWLSAELSRIPAVTEVYAIDFSRVLLEQVAPGILAELDARSEKITRVVCDFNDMPFPDGWFDFVTCDAALHHATDPVWLLREIHRLLAPGGRLVAIREPVLSTVKWLARRQTRRFGAEERSYGVTERIYAVEEWRRMFAEAGFQHRFVPFIHHTTMKGRLVRFSPLRLLNGRLFSVGVMVGAR